MITAFGSLAAIVAWMVFGIYHETKKTKKKQ